MSKPVPLGDQDTAPYWEAARRQELALQQCGQCGALRFPPRPRCPGCLSETATWQTLSGRGRVHTFCVTRMPLVRGFEPPYVVAVVELDEQADCRLTANLLDCPIDQVKIGMRVEVTFEHRGEAVLPQFRPARNE